MFQLTGHYHGNKIYSTHRTIMHSRAYLLLRRDLQDLQRFPLPGITAMPANNDNLFHWTAKLAGLGSTVWEGGVFQVMLSFNEEFNTVPPKIHFLTIPFHPNVDPQDGSPHSHLLGGGGWSEECTVSSMLLALQVLLGSPELDGGCVVNTEAARLFQEAPHTYRQMALDCVTASLRIEAGLPPYECKEEGVGRPSSPKVSRPPSLPRERRKIRKRAAISFDEYHALWKGIATSVTEYHHTNSLAKLLGKDAHLRGVHCRQDLEEKQRGLEKRLEEHTLLKYGSGKHPRGKRALPTMADPCARMQRIDELKQMYREATSSDKGTIQPPHTAESSNDVEVDNLLQWTRNLDEHELNT